MLRTHALATDRRSRAGFGIPSWAISGGVHLTLLLVLGLALPRTMPGGGAETDRPAGIVLRSSGESEADYLDADDLAAAEAQETSTPAERALDDLFDNAPPSDPTSALPAAPLLGPGANDPGGATNARELTASGGTPGGGASAGRGSTRVFGLTGTGFKFVYVFDRSGSMGGSGRSALAAAKAELLASLESLEPHHQFQIVFYNDEPARFQPDSQAWRLVFATPANKELAAQFLGGVKADGATEHERALMLALKLAPDVIFFLTDADQPVLNRTQLNRIAELNSGQTVINAIEFGLGPALSKDNFLSQLAGQNGGEHTYVDVSQLGVTR